MELKKGLDISSDDFWYDLSEGGYLDPFEICADKKDAQRVVDAVATIKSFQQACEEQIDNFIQ